MAQPSLNAAIDALAAAIGTVTGIRVKAYRDTSVTADEVQIEQQPFDPRVVFGAIGTKTEFQYQVRIIVKATDVRAAQRKLNDLVDPTGTATSSVVVAIGDGTSWQETIDYAVVTNVDPPYEFETPSEVYLARDVTVEVVW